MGSVAVGKIGKYNRTLCAPPDKSISVRAVILCSYSSGRSIVKNISRCDDVMSAVACMESLGASVEFRGDDAVIVGAPFKSAKLNCGNSGTTARLLIGLLSGLSGVFELDGDESLKRRPMARVIEPLKIMGAKISDTDGKLPVTVTGAPLGGIKFFSPVPGAQVKSAIMLAALGGTATVEITEKIKTRDHTEIMLKSLNGSVSVNENTVTVSPSVLFGSEIYVPGDLSAALYPICLALISRGKCTVRGVGLNPTRLAAMELLKKIGAKIEFTDVVNADEPYGDITAEYVGPLRPFSLDGDDVARMIDEVPVLCSLACFIDGKCVITGASELRKKESDRISATVSALSALGADIEENEDGITVRGGKALKFGTVKAYGDHRIAMSAAVAAAAGEGGIIEDGDVVSISYPNFFEEVLGV